MIKAISEINVSILEEFTRIMRPQKYAKDIGKLFCLLLCTFRQPALGPEFPFLMVEEEFQDWDSVKHFLLQNANKTLSECVAIKQKAFDPKAINMSFAHRIAE